MWEMMVLLSLITCETMLKFKKNNETKHFPARFILSHIFLKGRLTCDLYNMAAEMKLKLCGNSQAAK